MPVMNHELKQLVEDLLSVSQSLLQEIHAAKSQSEMNKRRSPAWVPGTQAGTGAGGRPRFSITKEQIETLRKTGMHMNWKEIAAPFTYRLTNWFCFGNLVEGSKWRALYQACLVHKRCC